MRTLLSYFFLIILLFPSVVELIHTIDDSHSHYTSVDRTTNFYEEINDCDLALYFSIDLDNSSNDLYQAKDYNNFLNENNIFSQNLIPNCSSSGIYYRGPPIT